jgi:hypothetical protein
MYDSLEQLLPHLNDTSPLSSSVLFLRELNYLTRHTQCVLCLSELVSHVRATQQYEYEFAYSTCLGGSYGASRAPRSFQTILGCCQSTSLELSRSVPSILSTRGARELDDGSYYSPHLQNIVLKGGTSFDIFSSEIN